MLVAELVEEMRAQGVALSWVWAPREENVEADQLGNLELRGFSPHREVKVDPANLKWRILEELMISSQKLYEDIQNERKGRQPATRKYAAGRPGAKRHPPGLASW